MKKLITLAAAVSILSPCLAFAEPQATQDTTTQKAPVVSAEKSTTATQKKLANAIPKCHKKAKDSHSLQG